MNGRFNTTPPCAGLIYQTTGSTPLTADHHTVATFRAILNVCKHGGAVPEVSADSTWAILENALLQCGGQWVSMPQDCKCRKPGDAAFRQAGDDLTRTCNDAHFILPGMNDRRDLAQSRFRWNMSA